ncbi:PREDICTED: uncharacterized protein LOC106803936 [Ceratotherium simum simum]|uniref:Uncharacterized protein LOC106803936 n=1 Tax=Ceratotherium simum simum TaxID=73337 RepID=A0ABM1DKZ9_CERSS|nr:PREDICTED: uncharacterized protein LOC106803936 [Ceratotherium simum simum]
MQGERAGPRSEVMATVRPSSSSKSRAPEDYQVLLGSTQLYQHTQHTRAMSVSRIITHPDFEKFHPFGSDIAMLQLLLPVNFTAYIVPACLPAPGMQPPSHASCWITGWGMLSEDGEGCGRGKDEGRLGGEGRRGAGRRGCGSARGVPRQSPVHRGPLCLICRGLDILVLVLKSMVLKLLSSQSLPLCESGNLTSGIRNLGSWSPPGS